MFKRLIALMIMLTLGTSVVTTAEESQMKANIVAEAIADVVLDVNTISQEQLAARQQAILDANQDVQQDISGTKWFLLGAFNGITTYFNIANNTPEVPPTRLLGKSPECIVFYTAEYQSKAKNKMIKSSCLGMGTVPLLFCAYQGNSYSQCRCSAVDC